MATDPTYPPETTEVGGTITGFDIDLAGAMASEMGLKVKVVKVFEDTIIPGFTAADRKYDMGISAQPETTGITSTAHTLVYLDTGQSLIAGAADRSITGLGSVCGRQVGGVRGSTGETELLLENERGCKSNPVLVQHYDDDVSGARDVGLGKLAAFVDDYPSAVFLERSIAGIRVVPHHFARAHEVMVFQATDAAVHDAVAAAFDRLRKDGTYARLLHKWGLDEGAIS